MTRSVALNFKPTSIHQHSPLPDTVDFPQPDCSLSFLTDRFLRCKHAVFHCTLAPHSARCSTIRTTKQLLRPDILRQLRILHQLGSNIWLCSLRRPGCRATTRHGHNHQHLCFLGCRHHTTLEPECQSWPSQHPADLFTELDSWSFHPRPGAHAIQYMWCLAGIVDAWQWALANDWRDRHHRICQ